MNIGLAYDLKEDHLALGRSKEEVAELDERDTIEGLAKSLESLGHTVDFIGSAVALSALLVQGKRWDLVFNICEGIHGSCRESQAPAVMELFSQPFIGSSAFTLAICHHKPTAKRVATCAGVSTPDFTEVNSQKEVELAANTMTFPLFVKPSSEGSGKGIASTSRVTNAADLMAECQKIWTKFRQSALVETYLNGQEYTVGIIGSGASAKVIGVMSVDFKNNERENIYSMHVKTHYEDMVSYRLCVGKEAESAASVALAAHKSLGCYDFARHDIRSDQSGTPYFLEVNPLPGMNYRTSDLPIMANLAGMSYEQLVREIVDSARERLGIL